MSENYLEIDISTKWFAGSFVLRMRCYASGWVTLALPVWKGLIQDFYGV